MIMNPMMKNVLGPVIGLLLGMLTNIGLILLFLQIFPLPEGVELKQESLDAHIQSFEWKHFIAPFLGHAGGTFAGAWVACRMMEKKQWLGAVIIGSFFLLGGIMEVGARETPLWFAILDIGLAYLPMSWLGFLLAKNA